MLISLKCVSDCALFQLNIFKNQPSIDNCALIRFIILALSLIRWRVRYRSIRYHFRCCLFDNHHVNSSSIYSTQFKAAKWQTEKQDRVTLWWTRLGRKSKRRFVFTFYVHSFWINSLFTHSSFVQTFTKWCNAHLVKKLGGQAAINKITDDFQVITSFEKID